jgi:orotidine-5'-phosphate decarboxylase
MRMPVHLPADAEGVYAFCAAIMDATSDLVCAFKPNIAFFEAFGAAGWSALERLIRLRPGPPIILDAKRGDIGSTAEAYARAAFEVLDADAVTVNPYLGGDALEPFLRHSQRDVSFSAKHRTLAATICRICAWRMDARCIWRLRRWRATAGICTAIQGW